MQQLQIKDNKTIEELGSDDPSNLDDSNEVKAMVGKPIEEIRLRKLMK